MSVETLRRDVPGAVIVPLSTATCILRNCPRPPRLNGWCFAHQNLPDVFPGASYHTMHGHLYKYRGSAKGQACVGCEGPAGEWAYDHQDPDELVEGVLYGKRKYPMQYSVKLANYLPLCKQCHNILDAVVRFSPERVELLIRRVLYLQGTG